MGGATSGGARSRWRERIARHSAPFAVRQGFKLTFEFLENEFFTNSVLTKTYFVDNLWTDMSEPDLVKVEATAVDWKPGKNLTVETVTVKPKKKGRKAQGPKTVTRSRPSFFAFFTPFNLDEDEEEEHEGEDDEDEAVRRVAARNQRLRCPPARPPARPRRTRSSSACRWTSIWAL